ncbi:hypothetical protein FQN51_000236 [Onygenales sp. PD_10]|nr:hypothetical protein FQN51_000236 [Onygenales sp. PD_10]
MNLDLFYTLTAVLVYMNICNGVSTPSKTTIGLVATLGVSPRTTTPPNIPGGLHNRQHLFDKGRDIVPGSICGLVDDDPQNQLSCVFESANCVYSGTVAGCCVSEDINECSTTINTSCRPSSAGCDEDCENDKQIMYCSGSEEYCATYFFPQMTTNQGEDKERRQITMYGCRSYEETRTVLPMAHYYSSFLERRYIPLDTKRLSGQMVSDPKTRTKPAPVTGTHAGSSGMGEATGALDPDDPNKKSSLSGQHIAAIIIGVLVFVLAISALALWLISKKRKKTDLRRGSYMPPSAQSSRPSTIMIPMLELNRMESEWSGEVRSRMGVR